MAQAKVWPRDPMAWDGRVPTVPFTAESPAAVETAPTQIADADRRR
ncbi:MAG: hypothetical protein AAF677_17875 [Pseudomonadota bacterium]